ncbi:type II toxin-antitoxin system Phd/YefM family antitoxin [Synergistaceae bacterium OttesenSCG-928-I11]|nr:type II toxin-antitoxin system Phd/YefM family antitoxin [Synergistaceae bacterium OttesenSCG-928-I11]
MITLTANEAKTGFGDMLMKVQKTPVQITKSGKPVAVLLSLEDYEAAEEMKLRELRKIIENGERELANGDYTDGKTFMRELIDGI